MDSAINQLLDHPRVDTSITPERSGSHTASNKYDTSTFNLRVDYVLPSNDGFHPLGGAVFWPTGGQAGANLVTVSDHRPVYMDLQLVPLIEEAVADLSVNHLPNEVRLTWTYDDEVTYRLEESADLQNASWQTVTGVAMTTVGGSATFAVPRSHDTRFYRIVAFFE